MQKKAPEKYEYQKIIDRIDQKINYLDYLGKKENLPRIRKTSPPKLEVKAPEPEIKSIQKSDSPEKKKSETQDTGFWENTFFQDEGIVAADLPVESELNVSGRKFIKINLDRTSFPNDPEKDANSNVSIEQQLQVKIRGSIADDLLEVKIDFDDSLPKVERQKTKILYNGRERNLGYATFQAGGKFGDVNLSLPGSNFVSYSKQVFGLSGQAHLRDINLLGWNPNLISFYGVASESKGNTEKKSFTGKKRRRIPDPIPDIQPIRRTYYQPLADTPESNRSSILPIKVESESIFLDDQNADNNDANTIEDKTVSNGTVNYTGNFEELNPGDDYSINYQTGILRMKQNIQNDYVIAVSMTLSNGQQITDFMIKDESESSNFDKYELQNRYRLASRNIVRNDPDRVLEIRDSNDENRPSGGGKTYAEILGVDQNGDGNIDDEFIDFELGVIRFPNTQPFTTQALVDQGVDTNPTIYGPPSQRERVYKIYQEVLVEENTYTLGTNVVRNSENVNVDGQNLTRGQDYTIDYQTGFLTFFDQVDIDEETEIEVTFESSGVGTQRDKTFYGGRIESDISDNLSIGSTLLTSQESEQTTIPQLGQGTRGTSISEFDIQWNPLHSVQDLLGSIVHESWRTHPWDDNVSLNMQWEEASSEFNPNQEGSAVVDDFDQLDQRVPFSKNEFDWSPADPVQQYPGDSTVLDNRSEIQFDDVDNQGHDPDPPADRSQKSMRVTIPMDSSDTWASFQQLFARNDRDLRGFEFIELWIKKEQNVEGGTLSLDLGKVTENTNREDNLLTEDSNFDDVLNPGEDVGYRTHNWLFGENNGQLDSEDLNRNGRKDVTEQYIHFEGFNKNSEVDTETTSHGWTLYKIPLKASFAELMGDADITGKNPTDTPNSIKNVLKNTSMVRLTFEKENPGQKIEFLMEQMGVVNTRWQTSSNKSSFRVDVVSEAEEQDRLPAPNTDQFRSEDEERLSKGMSYVFDSIDESDSNFTSAFLRLGGDDLTSYGNLSLLFNTGDLRSVDRPDTGYLRFGSDDQNYFQYSFDLDDKPLDSDPWIKSLGGNWFRLNVNLRQFEDDLIQKTLNDVTQFRKNGRLIVGSPSLLDVKRYRIGIVGPPGGSGLPQSILWEALHLNDVRNDQGGAEELKVSTDIQEGFLNLTGKDRKVDGEFRSIGLVNNSTANDFVPQNEVSQSLSGGIDLNRFLPDNWGIKVPLSFNWSDQTTIIPPDRVERVRRDDLGEVDQEQLSFNSGFNTPSLFPDFNMNWSEDDKFVTQTQRDREWTENRRNWDIGTNYSTSFEGYIGGFLPIGKSLNFNASAKYQKSDDKRETLGDVDVDTETREEVSRSLNMNMNYDPASWLNINPSYNFSDQFRETTRISGIISQGQNFNLSMNPSKIWGFQVRYNMGISFNDNFNRTGNVTKSSGVSGSSNFSLRTSPQDWWSELDFFSLNYSYRVDGSAQYENLGKNTSTGQLYSDFFGDVGWLLSGPSLNVSGETLSLSRSQGNKNLSHNVNGTLNFWEPLRTTFNFSLNEKFGQSDNSVNKTESRSFSVNNNAAYRYDVPIEELDWLGRNSRSMSMSVGYNLNFSLQQELQKRTHQINLRWSADWNDRWNTNFNLNTSLGRGENDNVKTKSRSISPSLGFSWLLNKPAQGSGTVWFDNRLEINGDLSAQLNNQEENGEIQQDDTRFSGNFGGAYNITERIKTRFSGNFSTFRDDFRGANNKRSFGFTGSMDFRF